MCGDQMTRDKLAMGSSAFTASWETGETTRGKKMNQWPILRNQRKEQKRIKHQRKDADSGTERLMPKNEVTEDKQNMDAFETLKQNTG